MQSRSWVAGTDRKREAGRGQGLVVAGSPFRRGEAVLAGPYRLGCGLGCSAGAGEIAGGQESTHRCFWRSDVAAIGPSSEPLAARLGSAAHELPGHSAYLARLLLG